MIRSSVGKMIVFVAHAYLPRMHGIKYMRTLRFNEIVRIRFELP